MTEQVFRERAIKAYQDPDTRGPLIQLAPPSVTRLLVVLGLVCALAIVASAFTHVQIMARGRGIVRPANGIVMLRAPAAATATGVTVVAGQHVEAGEVVFHAGVPIVSPVAGIVDSLVVHEGDFVPQGTAMAKVIPTSGDLVGYLLVESRDRSSLAVGQEVRLSLDEYPSAEMGFARGRVARISEDLVTRELASSYMIDGAAEMPPSFLVEVALDRMPARASGGFRNGMSFEGIVPVRRQRVLTLLIKPLSRVFGED